MRFRKTKLALGSIGLTAASLSSLTYLYNNNYLFSTSHLEYMNNNTIPLSYMESHIVRPLVKSTEGIVRFTRTMCYMSLIARRYLVLEYRYPSKDKNGKNIIYDDPLPNELWLQAHLKGAQEILHLCQVHGGIYAKFGQYLATMQNIIPEIYCETMEVLKDKAPPTSYANVEKIIYEEFGKRVQDLFREFEEEPIAAASVAQVHRAVTNDGREVAVKIQYPKVRLNYDVDVMTMDVIIHCASVLFPGWNMKDIAPDMKKDLYRELDFEHEKENARKAAKNFEHRKDVHIPVVFDDLSSKRVLTTEFIHGCKITDEQKMREWNIPVKEAARIMLEAFAEQIYIHGHLHADPHASNHFLRRNPTTGRVELVILDHGLYQELTDDFRRDFCRLWRALVVHDDHYVKEYAARIGIEDYQLFSAVMLMRTYDHTLAFSSKVKKQDFDDIKDVFRYQMERMMEILAKVPRQMLLILRTLNILRALNHHLGAPVNRFKINAEIANKGLHLEDSSQQMSLLQRFRAWREQMQFQWWIYRQTFASQWFDFWLRVGVMMRLLPPLPEMNDELILAA